MPFGEYVPFRSLLEPVRRRRACPTATPSPATGRPSSRPTVGPLGVVISWEVFFADRARDAVRHGGELLLNPTNGSSYWLTIVQTQQIASSRLRAMETGRWVAAGRPHRLQRLRHARRRRRRPHRGQRAAVRPGHDVTMRQGLTLYIRFGRLAHGPALALGLVAGGWLASRSSGYRGPTPTAGGRSA